MSKRKADVAFSVVIDDRTLTDKELAHTVADRVIDLITEGVRRVRQEASVTFDPSTVRVTISEVNEDDELRQHLAAVLAKEDWDQDDIAPVVDNLVKAVKEWQTANS
jgi:hypothetical protein